MSNWSERSVRVGNDEITLLEAGSGKPLLVFHDELGPTSWQTWHGELAESRRLVMPLVPGFTGERIGWIRSVRDLAALYGHLLRREGIAPIDVLGFSLGGWIAAEMLAANPGQFGKVALVAPFGIKPSDGFIMDFFPMAAADYVKHSVADAETTQGFDALYGPASPEQYESWEDARTECARLAWEPYMHNQSLEGLLRGVSDVPALLLWGEKDAILPESAIQQYLRSLPGSRAHVFKACGHRPEIERPQEFLSALNRFFA